MFRPVPIDNNYYNYSEFNGLCPGENNFLCFIEKTKVIYLNAKANIDSKAWSLLNERQAKRNQNVVFTRGEPKCNLFVYEILKASDIDIGTPNKAGKSHKILHLTGKDSRPPCTSDWFNNKVKFFEPVNDPTKAEIGDIITNGKHMGIVSGYHTTISASARFKDEFRVVNNDWGYRGDEGTIKIFRYNPFADYVEFNYDYTFNSSNAQIANDQGITQEDSGSCYDNNDGEFIQLCMEHPEYCEQVSDVPSDDIITIDDLLINKQDDIGTSTDSEIGKPSYTNIDDNHLNNDDHKQDEEKEDSNKIWILVGLGAIWNIIVYIICCRCC